MKVVQQAVVCRRRSMVELINNHNIEGIRCDLIEIDLSKRLNRRKDVPTLFWPMTLYEQLAEGSVAQDRTIRIQTLQQNLPPMCDKQKAGIPYSFC
jgi:hypothetical protein